MVAHLKYWLVLLFLELLYFLDAVHYCYIFQQDGSNEGQDDKTDIGRREKARLREMQQMKKQKIQDMLDAQNAAIDADMVCGISEYN